jgi:hypothetical protein
MNIVSNGTSDTIASSRMFKKAAQQGRSEAHGAMNKERYACARRRVGEPAVSSSRSVVVFTRPVPERAETRSFPEAVR